MEAATGSGAGVALPPRQQRCSLDPLRAAYSRKLSRVRLAPCARIVAAMNYTADVSRLVDGATILFEQHAVLDADRREVIHYDRRKVRAVPLEDFERNFGVWHVVELPDSMEHAVEVLERARSRIGEEEYSAISNNSEHFASFCFEGKATSRQVWSASANLLSSVKGGVTAGITAASATTTVTTPWYFMGIIPWGTTTTIVPAMSGAAAAGVGMGAFLGGMGVGLGASYLMSKWVESSNTRLAGEVPICVCNQSDEEVLVRLENMESSSSLYPAAVDDAVHNTRAYLGVGQRALELGVGVGGELNPPAEAELFQRFRLRVFVKKPSANRVCSWPSEMERTSCEVKRGDVLLYSAGRLEQVPDPGLAQPFAEVATARTGCGRCGGPCAPEVASEIA